MPWNSALLRRRWTTRPKRKPRGFRDGDGDGGFRRKKWEDFVNRMDGLSVEQKTWWFQVRLKDENLEQTNGEGWPLEAERYMSRLVFTITWTSKMISLVSLAACFAAGEMVWKSPDFWRKWSDVWTSWAANTWRCATRCAKKDVKKPMFFWGSQQKQILPILRWFITIISPFSLCPKWKPLSDKPRYRVLTWRCDFNMVSTPPESHSRKRNSTANHSIRWFIWVMPKTLLVVGLIVLCIYIHTDRQTWCNHVIQKSKNLDACNPMTEGFHPTEKSWNPSPENYP